MNGITIYEKWTVCRCSNQQVQMTQFHSLFLLLTLGACECVFVTSRYMYFCCGFVLDDIITNTGGQYRFCLFDLFQNNNQSLWNAMAYIILLPIGIQSMRFDAIWYGVVLQAMKNWGGNAVNTQRYLKMRLEFWNAKKICAQKNGVSRVACMPWLPALLVVWLCDNFSTPIIMIQSFPFEMHDTTE